MKQRLVDIIYPHYTDIVKEHNFIDSICLLHEKTGIPPLSPDCYYCEFLGKECTSPLCGKEKMIKVLLNRKK